MTALETALDYIKREWAPIPVEWKGKACLTKGWPKLRLTRDDAHEYFNGARMNVGVITGKASGELVDIDLDDRFAIALAEVFLPPTASRFGRSGKPNSHWLYRAKLRTERFALPERLVTDGEKATIVEIRANGGDDGTQTVFPGSVHESGEPIEWVSDEEPSVVEPSELGTAVGRLAAASLLARVARPGTRDVLAAAISGVLRRADWADDDIDALITAYTQAAGDGEQKRRRKAHEAEDRRQRAIARGAESPREYGWPTLRELVGEDVAHLLARWLDLESGSAIEELNREFAVVPVGGKVAILRQAPDREYPGTTRVEYWRKQDLDLHFANRTVRVGEKLVPLAKVWIASTQRRQHKGVVFEPGIADTSGYFNLWTRWGIEPRQGSWQRLRDHLYENVVDGDTRAGDWLLRWMADVIQHPNRPSEISVVLQGGRGVGKGILWNSFGRLFGRHYVQVTDPRHLVGNFNAHLVDKVLIFVDEGFFAGDKRQAAVLKGMITEPRVMIEPKFVDTFSIPNYRHVVFASNEDWVIPAGLDERRFVVFKVNPRRRQDREYFGKIVVDMQAGGYEALMYDLMQMDLTGFDVAQIPKTAALFEQKRRSFDAATEFWFDRLMDGALLPGHPWDEGVAVAELVHVFSESVSHPHERRGFETKLGSALSTLCPDRRVVRVKREGQRSRRYVFPPLGECREAFERVVGFKINWTTGDAIEE